MAQKLLIYGLFQKGRVLAQDGIAQELLVKLGIGVALRTVRKYIPIRDDSGPHACHGSLQGASEKRF